MTCILLLLAALYRLSQSDRTYLLVGVEGAVVGARQVEVATREQIHEIRGGGGVGAQGGQHHVTGRVAPAVGEVGGDCGAERRRDWLPVDDCTPPFRLWGTL